MIKEFNRNKLRIKSLSERISKTNLSFIVDPVLDPPYISEAVHSRLENLALNIRQARNNNSPVIFAFGAHLVKNGLSSIFIELMKKGYVQHILGSEAVAIHDWELAYQGETEEDVRLYVSQGQFGLWEETGRYINLAIRKGADRGEGYGEAIGKMISKGFIGKKKVSHKHKNISILGKAYEFGIPVSISVSIGENITHAHPECDGVALGITSYRDFLRFAKCVENLQNGAYISIGSAIKSPMVFEKALSMAKNVALKKGRSLDKYSIFVNDIQPSPWDWTKGEPPKDNPAYYLRFFKSFARMGGTSEYIQLDNRAFLHNLYCLLEKN